MKWLQQLLMKRLFRFLFFTLSLAVTQYHFLEVWKALILEKELKAYLKVIEAFREVYHNPFMKTNEC